MKEELKSGWYVTIADGNLESCFIVLAPDFDTAVEKAKDYVRSNYPAGEMRYVEAVRRSASVLV